MIEVFKIITGKYDDEIVVPLKKQIVPYIYIVLMSRL